MLIAVATRERAECLGRHVGAVLVREGRIVATGYNGTPRGFPRCNESEQGCHRCAHREQYPSGSAYDVCICVHAEQNAILQAARLGYSLDGAHCYTTLRPCFGCLKELRQAGVERIVYLNPWEPGGELERDAYDALLAQLAALGTTVEQLDLDPAVLQLEPGRRRARASSREAPAADRRALHAAGGRTGADRGGGLERWSARRLRSPPPCSRPGWRALAVRLGCDHVGIAAESLWRRLEYSVVPITHQRHSPPLVFKGALAWLPKASPL